MMRLKRFWIMFIALLFAGCAAPTPETIKETVVVKETVIVEVTQPPLPTYTAYPTYTPVPKRTSTPKPTSTPTQIPTPTADPYTLGPIVLTGEGDGAVSLEQSITIASIVHIMGNAAGQHFAVMTFDTNSEKLDLLVNAMEPYDGFHLIGFMEDVGPLRFQVDATGPWTIEIFPLSLSFMMEAGKVLEAPGSHSGTGDDVLFIPNAVDLMSVKGNPGGGHFAVIGYHPRRVILVNTLESPYEGVAIVNSVRGMVVEIDARGDWTIEVTAR